MKEFVLKTATSKKNGLRAKQCYQNKDMFNIYKYSHTGRRNGLVARYNAKTKKIIFDGSSWRMYKPYRHLSIDQIESIMKKKV